MRGIDIIEAAGTGSPRFPPLASAIAPTACLLTLAAFVLGLSVPCAQAAPTTIAEPGVGAGQTILPRSVAVDQSTGDLYVADTSNFRILKFDPEGEFLLAWGLGVADGVTPELQACGPEATPPTERCFASKSSFGDGAGAVSPEAIAVDNNPASPAFHDVYVADGNRRRVTRFGPAGEFKFMVGKEVNKTDDTNICTASDLGAGDECGRGERGAGPREFGGLGALASPTSLAIDSSGQVWVGDIDRLQELNPDGSFAAEVKLPGAGQTRALALDSAGDFYLKNSNIAGVRKLKAGTGELLYTLDGSGEPRAVAVDSEDNVYLGDRRSPYRFMRFDETGEQTGQFGAGQVIGEPGEGLGSNAIALDESAGRLYAAGGVVVQAFPLPEPGPLIEGQRAEDLLPESATLAAELNPEGEETEYRFEYGTDESYGQESPVLSLPASFEEETVEAPLEGLLPHTTYHFRLLATNHCNASEPAEVCTTEGPDTTFTTPTAVGIEAQWATGIGAFEATLHAEANPFGVAGLWWVEYGTDSGYGNMTPEAVLPASSDPLGLEVALSGLEPATTYHYRFAAREKRGAVEYVVEGPDRSFTTQPAGLGLRLPDDRVWEMASPAQKFGGRVGAAFDGEGLVQAAANGSGLAYLTRGSIEAQPEGNRAPEDSSVLARRSGSGQWSSRDLTPPHESVTPTSVGGGREYKLFSSDLSSALLEPRDCTKLSPDYTERTPSLRHNAEPHYFTPLVSAANVPAGTSPFGGDCTEYLSHTVNISGATPDLSQTLLRSFVPLIKGAPNGALYMWEAGQLTPVSFKPAGEGGGLGGGQPGSGAGSVRGAVSEDGSRVFWSTTGPKALYLRDLGREESLRLDAVKGGFGVVEASPTFQGASADGRVAFFTDSRQLTADASEAGRDLYRCEIVVKEGSLACELTDLSGATRKSTESADVLGLAPGIAADGSRIYFVARGVLDETPNAEEESAVTGEPNLYLWEAGAGVRFIATLAGEDFHDWGLSSSDSGGAEVASVLSAAASPSGRYLAFMSRRPLSGYDNRDADTGEAVQEVFRFDAQGGLACASCNPSGARPHGLRPGKDLSLEFDPQQLWAPAPWNLRKGVEVAAVLPDATQTEVGGISLYRSRAVQDNGRLFFNAADSLVSADSNGNGDVYQYEPRDAGDCSASSSGAGTAQALEGGACVSLISSGTAEGTSAFVDASVGGNDVFFYSPGRLAVTDKDRATDIYDARVGGIAATVSPRAECLGEACQPAPSAPEAPTPASASFFGPGNLREGGPSRCAKGMRKVRRHGKVRCLKRQRHPERHHRKHRKMGRAGR